MWTHYGLRIDTDEYFLNYSTDAGATYEDRAVRLYTLQTTVDGAIQLQMVDMF